MPNNFFDGFWSKKKQRETLAETPVVKQNLLNESQTQQPTIVPSAVNSSINVQANKTLNKSEVVAQDKKIELTQEQKRILYRIKSDCYDFTIEEMPTKAKFAEACLKKADILNLALKEKFLKQMLDFSEEVFLPLPQVPEIFTLELQLYKDKKSEIDALLPAFQKAEKALSDDILNFSAIVKEIKSKYKLSPDWNGKKPTLMKHSAELNMRKQKYIEDESKLLSQFAKLYPHAQKINTEYISFCKICLPLLNSVINS